MATSTNRASSPNPILRAHSQSNSPTSSPTHGSRSEINVRGSTSASSVRLSSYSIKSDSFSPEALNHDIYMVKNLDTGESIDIRDENSHSFSASFTRVVGRCDKEIEIKEFFRKKQLVNYELCEAVKENKVARVRELLDPEISSGMTASLNSKWLDDWTPLHFVANEGHQGVLEVFLQCSQVPNINAKSTMNRTPLHLAALKNHLGVVVMLVNNEADINALDNDGNTPLHLASHAGHTAIVKFMLQHYPVIIQNYAGRTQSDLAAHYAIFLLIVQYAESVDVNSISPYSRTPFNKVLLHNSRHDRVEKIMRVVNSKPPTGKALELFHNRPRLSTMSRKTSKRLNLAKINELADEDYTQEVSSSYLSSTEDPEYILSRVVQRASPRDFVYIHKLGKGSFGEVYLGKHVATDTLYAIKVLSKDKVAAQNLIRYATTEKRIMALIRHPFVVKLKYVFQTPEKLVLVMDYCRGGDLGSQLIRQRKLSEDVVRIYAAEVILAIEELHRHDIIYRDLKPDNVVLDEDGHAHLTDFGLSKEGVKMNKQTSSFCGSVAYLAPEMLKRSGHNHSLDWYLLGDLIYELLMGFPPFFSSDREKMFRNIQYAKLNLPTSLSQEALSLLEGLLNRNPSKRLGGGPRGVEDIKQHPFFSGIDWAVALQKKLKPPVPKLKSINLSNRINPETVFGRLENDANSRIEGWSFITP
eukprot:CAMPEP_0204897770 /NCGR_PEP_ID=MMETSP1397-20131031/917_1 /ASSEMBLY_ACC=CAM_ASM_000891 /TAXON_ID=49980 /ORGANISM="Climacostomum Climacostomum virens, Strain Stock W-24" /LENGTH=697 /DNA_ID=CAMNT_0052065545 /DNA_START=242 /DNA_END=2335 /DNA_ORIENTATION=-